MKTLSIHAQAAKLIRQDLKKAFPSHTFSVRSDSFAGGNSVHIEWSDGPTNDQVQAITGKYQYGSFDCMQDLYEHTNRIEGLPQVKYVQWRREISKEFIEMIFENFKKSHIGWENLTSIDETSQILKDKWSTWTAGEFIRRILWKYDLTKPLNINTIGGICPAGM